MMQRLLCLFFAILMTGAVAQADERRQTILVSLDVTQALVETLTEGADFDVVNVIPQGYAMRGQDAYLKKRQAEFFVLAERADAVVGVRSAWPSDPLYTWARRGNIRIVRIDAARPLDGYGAGVPLIEIDGATSPYVWRSPANLTRMAAIVADDLARLSPKDAETVKANLTRLQTALFSLRSKYELAFSSLDFVDLVAFTPDFASLVDEFGLAVHFHYLKQETAWTEADMRDLAARLDADMVKAAVCPWEPGEKGRAVLSGAGVTPVVLKRFVRDEAVAPLDDLVNWYEYNLSGLLSGLETN